MSDYPEHDKLSLVKDETQAAGEFIEWLASKGIHLMTYREDLTDTRLVDDVCRVSFNSDDPHPCDQIRHVDGDTGTAWWRRHCFHWQDPEREADGLAQQGHCCRCSKGRFREIQGVKAWMSPGKGLQDLLAEWADIDQDKIEAEKRQMLASIRAAQK